MQRQLPTGFLLIKNLLLTAAAPAAMSCSSIFPRFRIPYPSRGQNRNLRRLLLIGVGLIIIIIRTRTLSGKVAGLKDFFENIFSGHVLK